MNLRLAVHLKVSAAKLRQYFPHAEVIRVDLNDAAAVCQLVRGVNAIYYVRPAFHPRETGLGLNMIDAAVAENMRNPDSIRHFCLLIFHRYTQLNKLLNHVCKMPIDEDSQRVTEEYSWTRGLLSSQYGKFSVPYDSIKSQLFVRKSGEMGPMITTDAKEQYTLPRQSPVSQSIVR